MPVGGRAPRERFSVPGVIIRSVDSRQGTVEGRAQMRIHVITLFVECDGNVSIGSGRSEV